MKRSKFYNIFLSGVLLLLNTFTAFSQNNTDEPEPQKTSTGFMKSEVYLYKSKEAKSIVLTNRHGNIIIDTWDKDSVKIEYKINVGTFDKDLAKETLDQISINKYFVGKKLYLKTRFEEDFQSSFSFSINYHLHVPPALMVDITSNFGNIYITGLQKNIRVNAEYGKLFIKNDSTNTSKADLHLSFIEGEISKTDTVKVKLNNCTINLDHITELSGRTSFSVLKADTVSKVDLNTNIDRLTLNYVSSVSIKGEKTFCKINHLRDKGHFEINTGGLNVSVDNTLSSLTVANDKANTELQLPIGMPYLLHGEVKQGVLNHYAQNELKVLRDVDTITFSGEFGTNTETNIILFNTMSNLTIKEY